ncbi:hypothetical protein LguiA_005189 [Lonicera macranthoides]
MVKNTDMNMCDPSLRVESSVTNRVVELELPKFRALVSDKDVLLMTKWVLASYVIDVYVEKVNVVNVEENVEG